MLLHNGICKDDKVALLMYNCLEWLPIYFGILKTGAIAVPLNYRNNVKEIIYCIQLVKIKALIFGPEFSKPIESNVEQFSGNTLLIYYGDNCPSFADNYKTMTAKCSSTKPINTKISDDDFCAIYFSSGTTGLPKAILHKHHCLTQAAQMEAKHHNTCRKDVFLCIPPLYHTGAKFHWMGSLISGSRAILLKGTKPENILFAVSQEKCTIVWLLVPWIQDILDALDRKQLNLTNYNLNQWRLMHTGAQPVPPNLIRHWKEYFPQQDYDTNYGLSEASGPGCIHLGIKNIHKLGAIGTPGYRWQCRIIDKNGKDVTQGEIGELCVKGPGVMTCYYNNEKATAEVLKEGWLLTGDMARQDADGFFYLEDRKKDIIISGGENISPAQIEDFLYKFKKVKDVAVIGLPDRRLGEICAAVIELKEGVTCSEEEIELFCQALPRYKRPKKIFFESVPRNATGKIEKNVLRKLHFSENQQTLPV